MKYYLNEPYLKGKEKEYVLDVLESGWLSVKGKHTKIFEEKFAELVGVSHALAVQSGTAALHTSLLALGIGKGDRVVIPNYTCSASVTTPLQCNAIPAILDVENETFGLDAGGLEKYIQKEGKPKAVMVVDVYGFPARDKEKIVDICKEEDVFLIEDCCEAHGAKYKGKTLGSFGDIAAFSTRSEKMMGVGEGGMVVTDEDELIENAFYWATRASPYRRGHPYWYQYYFSGVGMNYLMPHLLGAVGRAQVENFDEIFNRKKAVGERYQEILGDIPGVRVQKKISEAEPSYWLNIALLEDKSKNKVRKIGGKLIEKGIEIRPAFWPLGNQSVFKKYAWGSQEVGKYIFEKGLVLPSSVFLANNNCEGVEEIVDTFRNLL